MPISASRSFRKANSWACFCWKENGVFSVSTIPEAAPAAQGKVVPFVNPTVEAINAKADRENYYAAKKAKAESEQKKESEKK